MHSSKQQALLASAQKHLLGNYRQAPFVIQRGKGCELFDTEGRRYLDMCAGIAVSCLGHAHPRLCATIAQQAALLMHTSNYFFNEENIQLAEDLCLKMGFDRAFFCNSGAEANEAMLKLARRYFFVRGEVNRVRIVAFEKAFHGRTLATTSVTGTPKYHQGFGPLLPGVTHVPFGNIDAVQKVIDSDVAAIVVEPVQGEGGVTPAPPGFLVALRQLADASGALLLLDEVQTGVARTGYWLGSMHDGVAGDAVALAKGLAGGFPIGAMLLRDKLNEALPPGTHGSTFGGNPLASAAARTVLAVIEEQDLCGAASRLGARLRRGLDELVSRLPHICIGARGRGLLQGLHLAPGLDARAALACVFKYGVLLTVAGPDVLRFSPPLVIDETQIDEALHAVDLALREAFP